MNVGWGHPFEKGCSPNPFLKLLQPKPEGRFSHKHRTLIPLFCQTGLWLKRPSALGHKQV